jgi:hypothetical protein
MRLEMEALQRQTKSPSRSPPSSPIKKVLVIVFRLLYFVVLGLSKLGHCFLLTFYKCALRMFVQFGVASIKGKMTFLNYR